MTDTPLRLIIHTDGGCRGNPGPASAAFVISAPDGTSLHEAGIYLGKATNNIAEYKAVIAALEAAELFQADEITLFSDSQLLVRQMNGQYKVKNKGLQPLYQQAQTLMRRFRVSEIIHVRRDKNEAADRLANQALDMKANVGDAAE